MPLRNSCLFLLLQPPTTHLQPKSQRNTIRPRKRRKTFFGSFLCLLGTFSVWLDFSWSLLCVTRPKQVVWFMGSGTYCVCPLDTSSSLHIPYVISQTDLGVSCAVNNALCFVVCSRCCVVPCRALAVLYNVVL